MAFKLKGMDFGKGAAGLNQAKHSSMSKMVNDAPYNYVGVKPAEWSENDKYDIKTRKGKNLFGRDRTVEKFYDKETGKKVGKKVTVSRGKNDPRADKVKAKRVNRGLTQEGGVGKIRVGADYFDGKSAQKGDSKDSTSKNENTVKPATKPINRAERAADLKDKNVTKDETGKPSIPKYSEAFANMEVKDGMRINPRNKSTYSDDAAGQAKFEEEAESWWAKQAKKTSNENLKKQNQPYGREYGSPNKKKKRGYSMKNAPFKNYKKGYYGVN